MYIQLLFQDTRNLIIKHISWLIYLLTFIILFSLILHKISHFFQSNEQICNILSCFLESEISYIFFMGIVLIYHFCIYFYLPFLFLAKLLNIPIKFLNIFYKSFFFLITILCTIMIAYAVGIYIIPASASSFRQFFFVMAIAIASSTYFYFLPICLFTQTIKDAFEESFSLAKKFSTIILLCNVILSFRITYANIVNWALSWNVWCYKLLYLNFYTFNEANEVIKQHDMQINTISMNIDFFSIPAIIISCIIACLLYSYFCFYVALYNQLKIQNNNN